MCYSPILQKEERRGRRGHGVVGDIRGEGVSLLEGMELISVDYRVNRSHLSWC